MHDNKKNHEDLFIICSFVHEKHDFDYEGSQLLLFCTHTMIVHRFPYQEIVALYIFIINRTEGAYIHMMML